MSGRNFALETAEHLLQLEKNYTKRLTSEVAELREKVRARDAEVLSLKLELLRTRRGLVASQVRK